MSTEEIVKGVNVLLDELTEIYEAKSKKTQERKDYYKGIYDGIEMVKRQYQFFFKSVLKEEKN